MSGGESSANDPSGCLRNVILKLILSICYTTPMNWWILKRKMYVSWQIAVICGGVFIGVFLAQYLKVSSVLMTVGLAVSVLCVTFAVWWRFLYLIPLLIVGGILLGLWRGSLSQAELTQLHRLYGHIVVPEGTVKEDVDVGASGQSIIRLDNLIIEDENINGVLWATTADDQDIKRGDKLVVKGELSEGFGSFAATMYRADIIKVIHPVPGDVARVIRDWFADSVRQAVPEPQASLGIGYLVGQRRSLPADLSMALQIAGLTHIVVASGYNLTILVRLAKRLFEKVSKYMSALSASAMIVIFIAITGVSPSMSRAGLVAGLSLAAWYYGRRFHPVALLSFAVAVTVLINPSYAWGDLGWQLSFAAFAGVMIVAPLLQRYFFGEKKPGLIKQILGETISAQLATAPILIAAFGQLSNVAIVANLLILPLVPLAMLLTFMSGIGSLLVPMAAEIIGMPATWLLQYMVSVAEHMASLPWAVGTFDLSAIGVILCYAGLVAFCFYLRRATGFNLREVNIVE